MKKLILSELLLLFLSTTFISDTPPGWFIQQLPVNDLINDIFFLDSLTGWVVTDGRTNTNDTGYVLKTSNSGNNWVIQYNQPMKLNAVQFIDSNTGYIAAASGSGTGRFFKTSNGGTNWNLIYSAGSLFTDLFFINKDTGWVCDPQGALGVGVIKTTNGGINWQTTQLTGNDFPQKLFFINKDTGWAGSSDWKLYRTTNGGTNWGLQYTFANPGIHSIYFINRDTGWITGGGGVNKTTNGGDNWTVISANGGGFTMQFLNQQVGFGGNIDNMINKTTNGGYGWLIQVSPIWDNSSISFADTLTGWAGGTGIVHTTDGGGPVGVIQISTEIPSNYRLYQNYPNPFNGKTKIKYEIANSKEQIGNIKLVIYSLEGKEVITLVNANQSAAGGAGTYEADFTGESFSSGVYFYSLIVDGRVIDTKKMLIVK